MLIHVLEKEMNEIQEQAVAFAKMHGDVLENIEKYAAEFRAIIEDFKVKFGRVPTADDLLWIASEHEGRDLRK